MQYHIARNGQQAGIFSEEDVRSKLLRNELSPEDLCWTDGMPDWQPLSVKFARTEPAADTETGEVNPYAPPQTSIFDRAKPVTLELASLGDRFLAQFVDGLCAVVAAIPLAIGVSTAGGLGALERGEVEALTPFSLGCIGLSVVLFIGLMIYNLVLLATRGQTIGKKLQAIRIVTYPGGHNPGGVKAVVLRVIVNVILGAVGHIGTVYSIVDICFIFRQDRRCIHDFIAGTQVVKGQPPEA